MFNIPQSNSAAGQLKRQYDKYLFEYECWHDRGNCDPEPIRKTLESKKKSKSKAAKSNFDVLEESVTMSLKFISLSNRNPNTLRLPPYFSGLSILVIQSSLGVRAEYRPRS